MKKTVKRTIMITVMVLAILGFVGCSLFSALPSILGTVLAFTSDGRVKEDITYTRSLFQQYTFGSDGTYTYGFYSWDTATESWYMSNGRRGTYTFNTDTYILTLTITDDYDITTGTSGAWAPETWYPTTSTFPAYFTSQNWYDDGLVSVADADTDNQWNYAYTYTDADNDDETLTVTTTVNPEIGGAVSINTDYVESPSGVDDYKEETRETGVIDNLFPTDTKFKKGDTVTAQFVTEASFRSWTPTLGWSTATTSTLAYDYTLVNLGDVVLLNPDLDPARVLEE